MHTDVTDLREFYQTPLGLVVRRVLAQKIRAKWPRPSGCALIGYGFAAPFLGSFRGEVKRLGVLMPEGQGALVWPAANRSMSVLVEEDFLPLADNSVDRLLVVHGLEFAQRPEILLREIWRVLTPEGRLLVLVPNRTGLWARTDRTPFGQGRPFSRHQLDVVLRRALFSPLDWDSVLYLPPVGQSLVLRSAATIERLGRGMTQRIGGVIVVEAGKELIAPIGSQVAAGLGRPRIAAPVAAGLPSGLDL